MSRSYDRVLRSAGFWDKVMLAVPGFRGYKKRELLRSAAELERRRASLSLRRAIDEMSSTLTCVVQADPSLAGRVQAALGRLDELRVRVESAEWGYSPMGGDVRVNSQELGILLQIDAGVADLAERIMQKCGEISSCCSRGEMNCVRMGLSELESLISQALQELKTRTLRYKGVT